MSSLDAAIAGETRFFDKVGRGDECWLFGINIDSACLTGLSGLTLDLFATAGTLTKLDDNRSTLKLTSLFYYG